MILREQKDVPSLLKSLCKLEWTMTRKERPCSLGGATQDYSELKALKIHLAFQAIIAPLRLLTN